jgi:hypothetical protein
MGFQWADTDATLCFSHSSTSVSSIVLLSEVPGAGFEPAKLYAEDLESTPFDRSGTPASC